MSREQISRQLLAFVSSASAVNTLFSITASSLLEFEGSGILTCCKFMQREIETLRVSHSRVIKKTGTNRTRNECVRRECLLKKKRSCRGSFTETEADPLKQNKTGAVCHMQAGEAVRRIITREPNYVRDSWRLNRNIGFLFISR